MKHNIVSECLQAGVQVSRRRSKVVTVLQPTCDNFPIENLYLLFMVLPTVHVVFSRIETVSIAN